MVVPMVRICRRYRDELPGVVFTDADNPADTSVLVWACREVVEPEEGLVVVLPRDTSAVGLQAVLEAGFTIRLGSASE